MAFKKILILDAGIGGMIVANKLARALRRAIARVRLRSLCWIETTHTSIRRALHSCPLDYTRLRSSVQELDSFAVRMVKRSRSI